MRYDPVIRAFICYLEFLRCSCLLNRIKPRIAMLQGIVFDIDLHRVGTYQLRRIHLNIILIDR